MEQELNTHWYVTYNYENSTGRGVGSRVLSTSETWFPIKGASAFIKEKTLAKTVIILSWVQLTQEQFEETKED